MKSFIWQNYSESKESEHFPFAVMLIRVLGKHFLHACPNHTPQSLIPMTVWWDVSIDGVLPQKSCDVGACRQ